MWMLEELKDSIPSRAHLLGYEIMRRYFGLLRVPMA